MKRQSRASLQEPLLGLTGYVLRRASAAALADFSQRLAPLDLRPTDAALLILLDAAPQVTHSEVATALGLRRPNLVPVVVGLQTRGLIERKRVDFRSEGLALTRQGEALLKKVRRIIALHEEQLMERVPPELRPMVLPILMALWSHGKDARSR
jgi:DNA-binding MarR family transcriptional regulator